MFDVLVLKTKNLSRWQANSMKMLKGLCQTAGQLFDVKVYLSVQLLCCRHVNGIDVELLQLGACPCYVVTVTRFFCD